ncbi:MAG: ParB/RepB/Spo0J family partition protein [Desulfobacteraceae bacterium]|nr:ParB/RepB/Spo0J family partition protein [Desulfobacteraceae bacterium]
MAKSKPKKDALMDIPLKQIRKTTNNVRKTRDKAAQDGLVSSIRSVGLLQPIIVRPIPPEGEAIYEIAYGNSRYDAVAEIANFDLEQPIRAIVRNLSDDEAFIANIVENLQRQNVSEEEEAAAFATFADRYGPGAIEILSDRIGSSQRYVRKRIMVMRLPKACLKAWKRGIIVYGHLEQMLRIQDKKKVLQLLAAIFLRKSEGAPIMVSELRDIIDKAAIKLDLAKFDTAECLGCIKNSATQLSLFGVGSEDAKCGNPQCFIKKQGAWLKGNWQDSEFNIKHTNAFAFAFDRPEITSYIPTYQAPHKRCTTCDSYASILNLDCTVDPYHQCRVCLGPKGCYDGLVAGARAEANASKKNGEPAGPESAKPRVDWHGEYFRQSFYKTEIPRVLKTLDRKERMKVALYNLLHANMSSRDWLRKKFFADRESHLFDYCRILDIMDLLEPYSELDLADMITATIEALPLIHQSFTDEDRRILADHIKVDVGNWWITEEYLAKKTKAEILAIINECGFMNDPLFTKWMKDKHKMVLVEPLGTLKKSELVDMILKSGADLNRVPKEISDMPKIPDWNLRSPMTKKSESEDAGETGEEDGDDLEELPELPPDFDEGKVLTEVFAGSESIA